MVNVFRIIELRPLKIRMIKSLLIYTNFHKFHKSLKFQKPQKFHKSLKFQKPQIFQKSQKSQKFRKMPKMPKSAKMLISLKELEWLGNFKINFQKILKILKIFFKKGQKYQNFKKCQNLDIF